MIHAGLIAEETEIAPKAVVLPPPLAPFSYRLSKKPTLHGGSRRGALFPGPNIVSISGRDFSVQNHVICRPGGELTPGPGNSLAEDITGFLLESGSGISLAEFLSASLPAICAAIPAMPGAIVAGKSPTQAQRGVLERLGLEERFLPLRAPLALRTAITATREPPGAVPANADYLALMAILRDADAASVPYCAAILPGAGGPRFALRNRASLSAWLRARRAVLLAPESEHFATTAAELARATLVLIADPADAGLLGLCSRRAKILEIAPEGWATGKIRGFCAALGLDWQLFLASPPSYPLSRPLPFGAAAPLAYDIPIAALNLTLSMI